MEIPLTPVFAIRIFVGVCGDLYHQYFPSMWGIVIFQVHKSPCTFPHLKQSVTVVVGHCIDSITGPQHKGSYNFAQIHKIKFFFQSLYIATMDTIYAASSYEQLK